MTYTQHPLSAAFPAMSADDRQALKDSIESIGIQNAITIFEGQVLDGWHRYCIAAELMMDCPEVTLDADTDPRDFVLAQNKARRHITAAQLAMATSAVYVWRPVGKPKSHTECAIKTSLEMAQIAGVHRNTMVQAQTVQARATEEVKAAVQRGDIGLPKAAAIARLPQAEQAAAIVRPLPKHEKPAPKEYAVQEPAPEPEDVYSDHDAANDQIAGLQDALAIANMGQVDPSDRNQASELIAELRQEIKTLRATLRAVTTSRDTCMSENVELRRQITRQRREIDRATGTRTA